LYYADHHGYLIILVDAHLGMGVVWGAEGAQVRDVLLEFGEGRADSEALLNLTRVFIFGSHRHHLRIMKAPVLDAEKR